MAQQRFGVLDGVVLYGAISMVSLLATRRREDQAYYVKLDKPEWSPPPWLFGVVWPLLNAIQVSSDLTLMNEPRDPARRSLLALRGANWMLYSLYVPAFFRARSPTLGLVVAAAQAAVSYATIARAWRRSPRVALSLLPLSGWLTYATALSTAILLRNKAVQAHR